MVDLDPDWWKTLFDETYLITDARTVCDERLTRREVDFLQKVLRLEKAWSVLDLCGGQGRHALELSRRGFKDVTVLDYSKFLLDMGGYRAQKEGLNTLFVRRDARDTGLPSERFRVIIIMASSFGYFADEAENGKILREALRLLMPKGSLLLDLPNRDYVLKNFAPESRHDANEQIVVRRQRTLDEDVIYSRETVISKDRGLIRDASYCTRLYTPENITVLLKSVGFDSVAILKDFVSHDKSADYGLMSNRMIVIADKK